MLRAASTGLSVGGRRVTAGMVAALAIAAPALTACSASHAGAAAVVGGDRITVAQLQALVNRTLADPGFASKAGTDRASVQRQALTGLIRERLLDDAARDQGVSVTEGEVGSQISLVLKQEGSQDALNKDAAANGIAPADIHTYFYYAVLQNKLSSTITAPVVHAAHILVKDQATAEKILAEVKADPGSFATLAKSQSIDTASAAKGGDLGTTPSAQFVSKFADAVDSAQVGSYFVVQTQFGWHVVHLIARTQETLASITSGMQANDPSAQQVVVAVFSRYLDGVGKKAGGISVNPRYGSWDSDQGGVVAADGKLASAAPSSSPSASG